MDTSGNFIPVPGKQGFDLPLALSRAGGQMDLLKEIADLFLEDYPRSLHAIHAGVEARDLKAVEHAAHSVKGSACNFGAPEVVDAAAELERKARGSDWAGLDSLVTNLEDALDRLRVQLEGLRQLR